MVSKPRGTRDFDVTEMEKRREIEKKMEATFRGFGYKEIATPTIEHSELFEMKSGASILDEIYSFKDKGGRDIALRPELTAPVMRFYVEKLQMETKPLKLFYFGNCFRYDRPQEGRYREFWQMGCELIGPSGPVAMAELIALAYHAIKNSGLKKIALRVGNLILLEEQVKQLFPPAMSSESYSSLKTEIFRLIDKNGLGGLPQVLEGVCPQPEKIDSFIDFLQCNTIDMLTRMFPHPTPSQHQELKNFEDLLCLLETFDVDITEVIDMKIARGLDYYLGTVFEIDAPKLGAEKQLCGGGSYELVPLLGGTGVPTAGFAIGFDRVMMALDKEGYQFPSCSQLIYLMSPDSDLSTEVIKIATTLRKSGFFVDFDLMNRNITKSLKYANKIGAYKTVIIGKKEWVNGKVIVKDMHSGEQQEVPHTELPTALG